MLGNLIELLAGGVSGAIEVAAKGVGKGIDLGAEHIGNRIDGGAELISHGIESVASAENRFTPKDARTAASLATDADADDGDDS